jgi:hypothetical protein
MTGERKKEIERMKNETRKEGKKKETSRRELGRFSSLLPTRTSKM